MATYYGYETEYIISAQSEHNSFIIMHSDEYMRDMNDKYLCIDRTPDIDGDYWLICDQQFLDLPFLLQKLFIWHEVGHIECQPVRRIQDDIERDNYRVQCILDGTVMEEELEADEYALEAFSKDELPQLMFQLDWFKLHTQLELGVVPATEFGRRIIHLQDIIFEILADNPAYMVA